MLPLFIDWLQINAYFYNGILATPIGLIFTGYWIERYIETNRKTMCVALVLFILGITFEVLCIRFFFYAKDSTDYFQLDNRFNFPIMFTAINLYILVKCLFSKMDQKESLLGKFICWIGSCTLGTYLLGDYLIIELAPFYDILKNNVHVMLAVVVYEIIVLVVGVAVTGVLRKMPYLCRML